LCLPRRTLFVGSAGANISRGGVVGVYNIAKYSRFTGRFGSVGSATLQWGVGVDSGTYQVTSSLPVNSGPTIFDQLNYGRFTEFSFSKAFSAQATYVVLGEGLR
jgi:hypothetical protein